MAAIPSSNPFLFAAVVWIFLVWIRRIFWLRRSNQGNPPLAPVSQKTVSQEKISLIVPARNEEKNIGHCLTHLFKQNYSPYEIIVVDDRSTDRTPHLLENFKKLSPVPLKVVRIEKLPTGWTGKNHAMFAGSKAATGTWLLFTDADTTHEPESLATAAACVTGKKIDLLTLAPRTECRSFWEDLVQPIAVGSLALWFNPARVNDPKSGTVLANGQFILVKKEVYEKVGGNEAVKTEVVEDVALAKKIRTAGFSVQFLNGTRLYSTRMYSTLKEIRTGWTRIYVYLFNKNILSILHKIFLFLFFSIFPFVLLVAEIFLKIKTSSYFDATLFWISFATCFFVVTVRFFGNKILRTNPWYALLHPVGSCVMVWILFSSIGRIVFNRPSKWRGDSYK